MTKNKISSDEAIVNLLILELLVKQVDIALIEKATGMDEKTIYARFPMKMIKQARSRSL